MSTHCLANDSVVIDYMVLYTPAAAERAGGEEAMLIRINNGVDFTNAALARSGLAHITYRLVHTQRLSGNNTSTDLWEALTEIGTFTNYYELRDAHLADSVSIIFEHVIPGAYGTIPLNGGQARRSFTYFGVLNYGGTTTAHELGHNMGGSHDNPQPEPPDNEVLYGTSHYGYNFYGTDGVYYKTIMSYGVQPDPNTPIEIVDSGHFSNPNILYQGHPTGREGYADMASSIRYWAPIISTTNYRSSPPPGEPGIFILGPLHMLLNKATP